MRMSFSRSIHSLGLTCRPRQWHTCGNRRHSGIYYGYWTSFPPSDLKKLPHAEESRGSLGPLTKNNLLCVCVGFVSFSHKHTPSQACVSVYLPGGCSQQHLPVVTPAVYEDITGRSVRAGATETLRSVALLKGTFILLHGQAVIGKTEFLVGRLWVKLEWLTWKKRGSICSFSLSKRNKGEGEVPHVLQPAPHPRRQRLERPNSKQKDLLVIGPVTFLLKCNTFQHRFLDWHLVVLCLSLTVWSGISCFWPLPQPSLISDLLLPGDSFAIIVRIIYLCFVAFTALCSDSMLLRLFNSWWFDTKVLCRQTGEMSRSLLSKNCSKVLPAWLSYLLNFNNNCFNTDDQHPVAIM